MVMMMMEILNDITYWPKERKDDVEHVEQQ